jgi:DNA-binding NarL/FixJ family response regulator
MKDLRGIVIIEDDSFTRTLLHAALTELDFDVVGVAASASEGLLLAHAPGVGFALIDLDLGEGPTGIDVAHGLRRVRPHIGIVLISTYEEPRLLGGKQSPLPPGAIFLVKKSILSSGILSKALMLSIDPLMRSGALLVSPPAGRSTQAKLTDLQLDMMRMVAMGASNAEIARRRTMTVPSVEKAIARITKQLGLESSPRTNQRVLLAQTYRHFTGTVDVRAI